MLLSAANPPTPQTSSLTSSVASVRGGSVLANYPLLQAICGLANLYHFLGTFLNHASRTRWAHRMDTSGMCFIIWFFVLYFACNCFFMITRGEAKCRSNGARGARRPILTRDDYRWQFQLLFCLLYTMGCALIFLVAGEPYSNPAWELRETGLVMGLILLLLGGIGVYVKDSWKYGISFDTKILKRSVAMILVAWLAHHCDQKGHVCWSESIWQGHAIWHVFGAAAVFGVWQFALSEWWK